MSFDFRNSVSDGLGDGTHGGTDLSIDTYTVMMWVKLNSLGGGSQARAIGRNSASDGRSTHMNLMTANNSTFDIARQGRTPIANDAKVKGTAWDFTTGGSADWHCYLGTYDDARSGRWQVFLDGVAANGAANDASGTFNPQTANEWMLGREFNGTSRSFDGLMGHVCVWSRVLTSQEIADLAAGGNPLTVAASGLIRYWPMNVNENPVVDVQGSGHNLNWVGSVSFEATDNPPVDPAIAIARVQAKQATGRDTSSITVTLDATATVGNLLVLRAGGRNATPSTPSGWTEVFFHQNSISANAWFGFYFKISDGTETGVTLTFSGGTRSAAQVEEWSNTEGWAADPVEALTSDTNESNDTSSVLPAVATGGHVLLMAGWGSNSGGMGTPSYTDSFDGDFFGSTGGGGTEGAAFGASREETVAGSYGVTASWVNSTSVVGALIAFTASSAEDTFTSGSRVLQATITAGQIVSLSGTGSNASRGSGALLATRGLVGSGSNAGSGSGELLAGAEIDLSGSGGSASGGRGELTLVRGMSGTGSAASNGSGNFSRTLGFNGAGSAASDGSGDLVIQGAATLLSGSGGASSAGSGQLSVGLALAGSGANASAGAGSGSFRRGVSGAGSSVSNGLGVIAPRRGITGTGKAVSSGSAKASFIRGLEGAGAGVGSGSAAITVLRALSGSGAAASSGRGSFDVGGLITLSGRGAAVVGGSGILNINRLISGAGSAASDGAAAVMIIRGMLGSGAAVSSGDGAVFPKRGLAGTGSMVSDGSGSLRKSMLMSGTGSGVSDGIGLMIIVGLYSATRLTFKGRVHKLVGSSEVSQSFKGRT